MPSCWMDSALSGRTEKQAKKWQMRELMLLDTAERLIQEHGFAQFNMDSLVRACDVSKGTVYNHFSSREDCIAGLYIGCMESLLKLFTRAASFQGSPREIVLAFHVAYRLHLRLFPLASESLLSSRTSSFLEKISLERAEYIKALDDEIFALTHSSTEKVFTESNLSLQEHLSVPVITFINWSLSYGINALMNTGFDNQARDQFDGLHIEMIGANIMMDGLGIRPLSTEFDYSVSWHRITNELFREEYEQLNNNPAVL